MQKMQRVRFLDTWVYPKPLTDYEKEVLEDLRVELALFSQKPKKGGQSAGREGATL